MDIYHKATLEQLQSIAQYEGDLSVNFHNLDEGNLYELTQEMLDILSTSKARRLHLYAPSFSSLNVGVLGSYSGPLSITTGVDIFSYMYDEIPHDSQLKNSNGLQELVQKYLGPSLSLSTIDELTNDLAQEIVKKPEPIIIDTISIKSPAIETLLKAKHKENLTITTTSTPLFCSTHIENQICHAGIWECNECDTSDLP